MWFRRPFLVRPHRPRSAKGPASGNLPFYKIAPMTEAPEYEQRAPRSATRRMKDAPKLEGRRPGSVPLFIF